MAAEAPTGDPRRRVGAHPADAGVHRGHRIVHAHPRRADHLARRPAFGSLVLGHAGVPHGARPDRRAAGMARAAHDRGVRAAGGDDPRLRDRARRARRRGRLRARLPRSRSSLWPIATAGHRPRPATSRGSGTSSTSRPSPPCSRSRFPLQIVWTALAPAPLRARAAHPGRLRARTSGSPSALDVSFALILGGVILTLGWVFRSVAANVDETRARAVASYAQAAAADAAEQERVAVAALMHDSVLAALIAAERAETPRERDARGVDGARGAHASRQHRAGRATRAATSRGTSRRIADEIERAAQRARRRPRRRASGRRRAPRRSPDASRARSRWPRRRRVANALQHAGRRRARRPSMRRAADAVRDRGARRRRGLRPRGGPRRPARHPRLDHRARRRGRRARGHRRPATTARPCGSAWREGAA